MKICYQFLKLYFQTDFNLCFCQLNGKQLITDVAKDLDLALQDLSPDVEISNSNGVIGENAGNDAVGGEESTNTFLFESIAIRTAGNNSQQNTVQRKSVIESNDDNNSKF